MRSIRSMLITVITMGVLIVIATAALLFKLVTDFGAPAAGPPGTSLTVSNLQQAAGSRIVNITGVGASLAVLLTGGGPDRILLVDPRNGRVTGRLEATP
jgi:hypothetical protein